MPTIKEYNAKKKKTRRRPGRETHHERHKHAEVVETPEEEQVTEVETTTESVSEELEATPSEEDTYGSHHPHPEQEGRKKVHISFPYSEMVRDKVPKVFEVAENVAEEWVNDGNFENLPVGHPLVQITLAAGLRKAKSVEKKLENAGVFHMAKSGLEYAKSKLNKR